MSPSRLIAAIPPWLFPAFSFTAGWVGYLAIERGPGLSRVIALTVLLTWPWMLVENLLGRWLQALSRNRLPPSLPGFVTQSLQQEVLFFALPFVLGATEMHPGHLLFAGLLLLAAMVSTLDPIYHRRIAASATGSVAFQVACTFVAALVTLPMAVHLPLHWVAPVAAVIGLLVLLAGLPRLLRDSAGLGPCLRAAVPIIAALLLLGAPLRTTLPPAGLRLTEARMTQSVHNLVPGTAVQTLTAASLHADGLVAFAAIHAPQGLSQELNFDWYHQGQRQDRIASRIEGVPGNGWRTYSRKRNFPADPSGDWRVDIRVPDGPLIGRLHFTVQ